MKKLILAAALFALAVASPALACGEKAGQMAQCPMGMKGVERSATNMDNGVVVTMAASDPEQVKTLQAAVAAEAKEEGGCACPMHAKGVKMLAENTSNGVKLTLTSDDKEQVKTLQDFAAKSCKGGCPMHGKAKAA